MQKQPAFHQRTFDGANITTDVAGMFLKNIDPYASSTDYLFGTTNGIFAVDTESGAILRLKKGTSKSFDPSYSGTLQGNLLPEDQRHYWNEQSGNRHSSTTDGSAGY